MKYDLTTYSYLYDGKNMTKMTDKAQLMNELEGYLQPADYEEGIPTNTCLMVDFMSYLRTQVISDENYKTFDNLIHTVYNRCVSLSSNSTIHLVFDSYCPMSLKGAERESRGKQTLELAKIDENTPIPKQMDKFWNFPLIIRSCFKNVQQKE